jgi:hypothetical protein
MKEILNIALGVLVFISGMVILSLIAEANARFWIWLKRRKQQ